MQKLGLCIGINNYPGTGSDLSGCVNDAHDWAGVLAAHGFVTKTLTDLAATRANVIANIKYLLGKAVKGDSVIIQFSGHGTQAPSEALDEPDKLDEAICVVSNDQKFIDIIYDYEIWSLMKAKRPGVQLVWLSDSCHSGSMVRAFEPVGAGTKKFLPWSVIMALQLALQVANVVVPMLTTREVRPAVDVWDVRSPWPCLLMSGCQDAEYSYDANYGGRGNGAFTYTALNTLQALKPGATYTDWFRAIRKALPSREYPQSPNILGSYQSAKIFS